MYTRGMAILEKRLIHVYKPKFLAISMDHEKRKSLITFEIFQKVNPK
jgi:hypothetical protein